LQRRDAEKRLEPVDVDGRQEVYKRAGKLERIFSLVGSGDERASRDVVAVARGGGGVPWRNTTSSGFAWQRA